MTREFRGQPDPADLITILEAGGVALLPTDTIYGLHALADNAAAVEKIVRMKARDAEKPFLVVGASLEQLEQAGAFFSATVRDIVVQLWPGPLTAIVPLRKSLAAARDAKTIGVRVPDHAWLRGVLERTGPLTSTSANRSGEPAIDSPQALSRDLHDALDALVDAGPLRGKASVLVDFTGPSPCLLREGERLFTQKVWKTLRKSL
jgi:L-threonylcarbamoyladenylate synthase